MRNVLFYDIEHKRLLTRPMFRRSLLQAGIALMENVPTSLFRPHTHDAIELVAVRSGVLIHEIAGQVVRSTPGCVDLVPPGLAHRYRTEGTCRIVNIIIDPLHCPDLELDRAATDLIQRICGRGARRPAQIPWSDPQRLFQQLAHLIDEQKDGRVGWQAALRYRYRLLLIDLARQGTGRVRWLTGGADPTADPHGLEDLRHAIDDHPERAWSLPLIARTLGVTPEHACRLFTARFGRSPMAYVLDHRLLMAQERLLRGEPVAAVAVAAGFASRVALHRTFSQQLGRGPRAWLRERGGSVA